MNTQIAYLYQKANGARTLTSEVVSGELSYKEQERIFKRCLQDDGYFIPGKVGLPEKDWASLGYDKYTKPEHIFCELDGFDTTDEEPTIPLTAKQLLNRFIAYEGREWTAWDFEKT